MNTSDKLIYVTLPSSFALDLGGFRLDPSIEVPFSVPEEREKMESGDYTVENLLSGLITSVAEDEKGENYTYYRNLVNAIDPEIVTKLNQAAIAKEQKGEYDFALLLFKAVYHLLPQSASCINLATLYSYMAVEKSKKGEDNRNDIKKARETLEGGLTLFGEDEDLLYECAAFEAFMGNLEEAKEYMDRYFSVATEGEKKEEMKKTYREVCFKIDNSEKIEEAYDFLSLGEPDKALPAIESFITNNPKIWNGYFLKGWAERIKNEFGEAKKNFLKCIELGESNAEIYNELGLCELGEGNSELAELYLESAYDLDSENLTVLTNLAFLSLGRNDYDKAREYLEKARYLAKDDKLVDHLIKKYEKETGEKIGEIIHEEIVKSEDKNGESVRDNLFRSFEKSDETVCDCQKVTDEN
jgi:tetratricopeptide (TPR) repeat protein